MRIIHLGDIHISETRIEEFELMLGHLANKIKEKNPDLIVFAGDLFIHRDRLTPKQVELARKFFKEDLKGIQTLMIPGNHDTSMSSKKVDSISAIFSGEFEIGTKVGSSIEIEDYKFHFFPYPSRQELDRLEVTDYSKLDKVESLFKIDPNKKNVLIFHGTMEKFNITDFVASEETIGIGKDLYIKKEFWSKFDCVMAGHLHKYQVVDKAVYCGTTFPLTYADSHSCGFVLWDDLTPEFVPITHMFPYKTVDIGSLVQFSTDPTGESVRRIMNDNDYINQRIRVKYSICGGQAGNINHAEIVKQFKNVLDVKVVPQYVPDKDRAATISLDDFKDASIYSLILKYIDDRNFHPDVKLIAKAIEDRIDEFYDENVTQMSFRLLKLRMENFKCFGKDVPEVDFSTLGSVVGIFGKNYTGKSALIEGIIWCLFGSTLRNKSIKSVIRNGETQAIVEVEFYSHKVLYKVVRARDKTKLALNIYRFNTNWGDISGATANETQKIIENLVGNLDMFSSTIYSPQNSIDKIIRKTAAERKQIILDCLQIDVLVRRNEEAKKLTKQVKESVGLEKGKKAAYSAQINEIINRKPEVLLEEFKILKVNEQVNYEMVFAHLNSMETKLASYTGLQTEHEALDKEIGAIRVELSEMISKLDHRKSKLKKMETILKNQGIIEEGIQKLKEARNKVEEYAAEKVRNLSRNNQIVVLQKEIDDIEDSFSTPLAILKASYERIENQIHNLKILDCDKPDCPLNEKMQQQKDSLVIEMDELSEEIVKTGREKEIRMSQKRVAIGELEKEVENSFYDERKHRDALADIKSEERFNWQNLKERIQAGEDVMKDAMEVIASFESNMKLLRERRDEKVTRAAEIAEKIVATDRYNRKIKETRLSVDKSKEKLDSYSNQISKLEKDIQIIGELQDMVKTQEKVVIETELKLNHCNKYREIIGKTGVMFRMVDRALPVLEKFTQDILAKTTDGALSIEMHSFKTLGSGQKADEVSIYLVDSKGKRDVCEGSGAEVVLLSLALRAAMAQLMSNRVGSKVELFIIDEGFGALDADNILVAKEMLRKLGNMFNQILIITHIGELKDVAQDVIRIKSDGFISTLKIERN